MIYHLSLWLKQYISWFNVFHYVSIRSMAALLTALFFSLLFGGWFIKKFAVLFRSKPREYTPANHKTKINLPTMGGIFIVITVIASSLLWCNLSKPDVWIFLLCVTLFGAIGFWDDWNKIRYRKGITARKKFVAQLVSATLIVCLWNFTISPDQTVVLPFFKDAQPYIGPLFIAWAVFIILGSCNAVNLTDGLDGLAIGSLIANFSTFSIIAYLAGHIKIADYLHIPYAGTAELTVIGAGLVGASMGFLWYNTYPAQVFMGDVGSLALGAGLALMALMTKQELLLLIAGGLFVIETLSVIMQVISFKIWKRRIFKMAPLHHHFELIGWPESKITTRFAIISIVLSLFALMTLKIR